MQCSDLGIYVPTRLAYSQGKYASHHSDHVLVFPPQDLQFVEVMVELDQLPSARCRRFKHD